MNKQVNNNKANNKANNSEQCLTKYIDALPHEMSPERDLWAGIERAISQKPQHVDDNASPQKVHFILTASMAWAASVVLAVTISWFTFTPTMQSQSSDHIAQKNVNTDNLVNFMEQNFKEQKQAMLVSFRQPDFSNLPVAMQDELTKLADARAAISKALLADENNVDLLNLLDFTQQQELKLLAQLYRQYQVI